jgi:hypothetical protein
MIPISKPLPGEEQQAPCWGTIDRALDEDQCKRRDRIDQEDLVWQRSWSIDLRGSIDTSASAYSMAVI